MKPLVQTIVSVLALATLASLSGAALAGDADNGRELYEIHCEACHGTDGRSPDPTIPDLGEGDATFMLDVELLDIIREGSATKPAFRGLLSEEEIRDIISYLRTF